jgi:hypothetical protein
VAFLFPESVIGSKMAAAIFVHPYFYHNLLP